MAFEYMKRICDKELSMKLDAFGAVHIVGPKWCGKNNNSKAICKKLYRMQDPDKRSMYLETPK